MERDADRVPVLNPYEKRLQETDRKLRDALDRLVKGTPRDGSLQERRYPLSVASLAREAGVARNAIYTNHRAMIDVVRRLRSSESYRASWRVGRTSWPSSAR